NQALAKYIAEEKALMHHAAETADLWRKIRFVCTFCLPHYWLTYPPVAVCTAWVYNAEAEHAAHIEHIKHENGGVLPEPPAYDYLNRRSKPFPWGNNSLFFNPHVNKNVEA
ncbi:cytochrome c oxidase, subunit VIa, partial [Ephemerocybe angulata]